MKFLIDLIFGRIAKSLDGYRTIIGGIGLILLGVAGMIGHYWPDSGVPGMDVDKAMEMIAGGFVALGIGGKLEKVIQK
jgi:hypothetical protein